MLALLSSGFRGYGLWNSHIASFAVSLRCSHCSHIPSLDLNHSQSILYWTLCFFPISRLFNTCFTTQWPSNSITSGGRGTSLLAGSWGSWYGSNREKWKMSWIFHCGGRSRRYNARPTFTMTGKGTNLLWSSLTEGRLVWILRRSK